MFDEHGVPRAAPLAEVALVETPDPEPGEDDDDDGRAGPEDAAAADADDPPATDDDPALLLEPVVARLDDEDPAELRAGPLEATRLRLEAAAALLDRVTSPLLDEEEPSRATHRPSWQVFSSRQSPSELHRALGRHALAHAASNTTPATRAAGGDGAGDVPGIGVGVMGGGRRLSTDPP